MEDTDLGIWEEWKGMSGASRQSQASKETGRKKKVPYPQATAEGRLLAMEQRFQRALGKLWDEGCGGSRCQRRQEQPGGAVVGGGATLPTLVKACPSPLGVLCFHVLFWWVVE